MAGTVLVNYWYAYPVGHAIEALRYCLGYKSATPELSVNLLLNDAMPLELVECCPFVDELYPVPYRSFDEPDGDPRAALAGVPRDWDWVVDNHREREASHDAFRGFRAFFDASHEHFRPRLGRTWTGGEPPAYLAHQQLRLELPESSRTRARETLQGRQAISVVLAGHSRCSTSSRSSRRARSSSRPTPASGSPRFRSARRGSRSRAASGTSCSSMASRSTRCCLTPTGTHASAGARRCRSSRPTRTARARGR
jgi:hypothetical protein